MFSGKIPHQHLVLDVNQNNSLEFLEMKQGDKGSRFIDIILLADGNKLECKEIAKSSKFVVSNSGKLLQNESFDINDDSTITVEVSENALFLSGILDCELVLYDEGDNRITSANFNIRVGKSAGGNNSAVIDQREKSITSAMLGNEIVGSEHLKKGSVTGEKLASGAVKDENLARAYCEHVSTVVYDFSYLDKLLEDTDTRSSIKTIYKIEFDTVFPERDETVGAYEYLGVSNTDRTELLLMNLSTGDMWKYIKGSNSIVHCSITDENLQRQYCEHVSTVVYDFSYLDKLLEDTDTRSSIKTIYKIEFDTVFPERDETVGDYEYYGIPKSDRSAMLLLNLSTGEFLEYIKGSQTISDLLIGDDRFDRVYWNKLSMLSVHSHALLNSLLESEVVTPEHTMYHLQFISQFEEYSDVGDDEYLGIPSNDATGLRLISLNSNKQFVYYKETGILEEISSSENYWERHVEQTTVTTINDLFSVVKYLNRYDEYRGSLTRVFVDINTEDNGRLYGDCLAYGIDVSTHNQLLAYIYLQNNTDGTSWVACNLNDNLSIRNNTTKISVDTELSKESENPVQNRVVAETFEKYANIDETIYISTFDALFNADNRSILRRHISSDITDSVSNTTLPAGEYICFGVFDGSKVGCWSCADNTLYCIERTEGGSEDEYHYNVTSSKEIADEKNYYSNKTIEGAFAEIGLTLLKTLKKDFESYPEGVPVTDSDTFVYHDAETDTIKSCRLSDLIDSELSEDSTKPLQNKVLAEILKKKMNFELISPVGIGTGDAELQALSGKNYIGFVTHGGTTYPYLFFNIYSEATNKNEQHKIYFRDESGVAKNVIEVYKRHGIPNDEGNIEWTEWVKFSTDGSVISSIDNVDFELILSPEREYRFTSAEGVNSLMLILPDSMPDDFECSLVFRSGDDTATSLTCPSSVKWSGDDIGSITETVDAVETTYNCLVPKANKTYNVIFWYDGFNVNAVSRGVDNG